MVDKMNRLQRPIDVVHLIHKALRAQAVRAEKEVEQLDALGGLHSFNMMFNSWVTNLITQTELKREHIGAALASGRRSGSTKPSYTLPQTDALEAEEVVSAPSADLSAAPLLSLEGELMESVEAVLNVLSEEIGKTSVITRTKQHVHRGVLALRYVQEDQFETEEALVLPALRDELSERRQLQIAKSLLIDEEADDPRWIIDWVASELDPAEQQQLTELEARFQRLSD
jgi:hypothetical protein